MTLGDKYAAWGRVEAITQEVEGALRGRRDAERLRELLTRLEWAYVHWGMELGREAAIQDRVRGLH